MKHHKHRHVVKFGLKCLLIHKINQKMGGGGGQVLMTKFGKSGKIGLSSFPFRTIQFW
jgi:hypothetical protein